MDQFSIADLARLSGVKPFTIRIWEKRYKALRPDRSPGNTRFYSNQQLRRLLNIVSLMQMNYKPSELCSLTDTTLFAMIGEHKLQQQQGVEEFLISQLIAAGISYDESHFSNTFSQAITRYGFIKGYTRIVYPMLERMGILWNSDKVNASHEHFITNLLRQKILSAIDLLPSPNNKAATWLLFLPENEFHETGLLIAHYLIRATGKRSVYMGANLPLSALQDASAGIRPDNLLFFFVHHLPSGERQEYLDTLASTIKNARIVVAGRQLSSDLKTSKRSQFVETVSALEELLA